MPRVYLAGPEVFRPDAPAYAARQKALCTRLGFHPVHPLDNDLDTGGHGRATAIFGANCDAMRGADALVANLSPFRGPGADPGTAFELGFMHALGRPVLAYTTAPDTLLDRVRRADPAARHDAENGLWTDCTGQLIEDFGLPENLMLAVSAAGGILVAPPGPDGALQALQHCLERLRRRLAQPSPD